MLKETLNWLESNAKTMLKCALVTLGTAVITGILTGIASAIEEATDESE